MKHSIYCITHFDSGKKYIGQYSKDVRIRFMEHICGVGSIAIFNLVENGAVVEDFHLEILESNIEKSEIYKRESFWIKYFNTAFPYGLNTGSATARFKKFENLKKTYVQNQWCIIQLENDFANDFKTLKTQIQEHIELIVKNQNLENALSYTSMEFLRTKFKKSYSSKNTFATKDMSEFFKKREQSYERVRSKNFTEGELMAQKSRSESMTKVWTTRSSLERQQILSNATLAAAKVNKKCK